MKFNIPVLQPPTKQIPKALSVESLEQSVAIEGVTKKENSFYYMLYKGN